MIFISVAKNGHLENFQRNLFFKKILFYKVEFHCDRISSIPTMTLYTDKIFKNINQDGNVGFGN